MHPIILFMVRRGILAVITGVMRFCVYAQLAYTSFLVYAFALREGFRSVVTAPCCMTAPCSYDDFVLVDGSMLRTFRRVFPWHVGRVALCVGQIRWAARRYGLDTVHAECQFLGCFLVGGFDAF